MSLVSLTVRTARIALAATALTALVVPAEARDRPGTPNGEMAWSPGPGEVSVRWQNTANEDNIVFDIEGQSDPSVANWTPGNVGMGSIVTYTFHNLAPGRHCFRIWSRVGAQGVRSDAPSALTCAMVTQAAGVKKPGPRPPAPAPAPTPKGPCVGLLCGPGGGLIDKRR